MNETISFKSNEFENKKNPLPAAASVQVIKNDQKLINMMPNQ